jgi:hypothetical protein
MDLAGFDPEAWLDVTAPALGLDVMPEWRPNVLLYLGLTAKAAALFVDWPLDVVKDELAPVFRPGPPQ